MAFICNKKDGCGNCSHHREYEGTMACWAQQDGEKIRDIIIDVWDANQHEALIYDGVKLLDFNIWVSFIMCYGWSDTEILEFAKIRGIEHDPADCDPSDPDDHYGALILTEDIIETLKGEK